MLCCIFASSSIFSDTEDLDLDDFDDLDLFPFVIDDYEDIASVLDHSDILLNDDLFSADILTSCLGDNNVVQLGKLRTRDSSCPAPEIPINIPQFPNILPSTQEPHALPPTLLENQGDLATTRPAEYFCSSPKYRGDIRFGRVPVPVCGPALPLQQGWPGSGVQGYYVNVEYSRLSKFSDLSSQTSSSLPCHVMSKRDFPSLSSGTFLPCGRCLLLSVLETIQPSETRMELPGGFGSWNPLFSSDRAGVDRL